MIGEDSMKKKKQTTLAVAIIIMVAAAIVAYAVYTVISAKPSNWQVEDRLSNTGTQDTTEFEMNNTWRIDWKINEQYDPFFVIVVFIKNATGYSSVATTSETDTNTTQGILPVPYTGTFVIRVLTQDDTTWTLYIEEFKPG